MLRYLFLFFFCYGSIGKSEKEFEKVSLRTAVLHAHAYLAKRRPLFTRIVLQILFWISQLNDKKANPKNPDLDFLIAIHPGDDFSEVKSVFRFRVRLGNLDLDFENLNPDFPIEHTLDHKQLTTLLMTLTLTPLLVKTSLYLELLVSL